MFPALQFKKQSVERIFRKKTCLKKNENSSQKSTHFDFSSKKIKILPKKTSWEGLAIFSFFKVASAGKKMMN